MNVRENQGESPIRILLVDDDPVFRLGFRVWLEQFTDIALVAEAEQGAIALDWLRVRQASDETGAAETAATPVEPVDLVVLSLELGRSAPDQMQGLSLCQRIRADYPQLPILVLSASSAPLMRSASEQAGAQGYVTKQSTAETLIAALRQVANGQPYWSVPSTLVPSAPRRPVFAPRSALPRGMVSPFQVLVRNVRISGLQQIEDALAQVTDQLLNEDLSLLDQAVLAGRHRELRVARWLVSRLLATPTLPPTPLDAEFSESSLSDSRPSQSSDSAPTEASVSPPESREPSRNAALAVSDVQQIAIAGVQASLFDSVLSKLQTSLRNQTDGPLEIDILREDKRRELLATVLRKLSDLLDELRYSEVQLHQLYERRSQLLVDLWQAVVINFFGKYYVVQMDNLEVELVGTIRQDAPTVQLEILDCIPFADQLLAHLLFQEPLEVDSIPCAVGTPEAMTRAEVLLDNLVIQVANAVVQPLLNRFSDVETIKQNFYDRRLISSRDITRFRNDLSWRYRTRRWVDEPKDIFESQYRLLIFRGTGIKPFAIYASRRDELEQLSGIPLLVTFVLELRDATAPRLRTAFSFVGQGVIYLLTDVVGRAIGLVVRGVLKGIGGAWNDIRFSRNGDRFK